ncbi:EamA family transporter [Nocardioides sp. URHA0020]|uniref:EamA family transporter n=1 Tax=Nocardioides sp. URHA0020 TaxID=1380392 RepID=UPI00048B7F1B|nr:EamA family transporter [Nocardioides sp. URHA0020]
MSHHEPSAGPAGRSTAATLTVLSMSSVQLSDALSLPVIDTLGAAGTAWVRAACGALLLLALVRPRVRSLSVHQWQSIVPLGILSGGLSLCFLAALQWLPLGTAVAIEFLGPLGVAFVGSGRRGARWPLLALLGVVALTRPWQGDVPLVGVLLALAAAACWAGCIVLTARVGDRVAGLDGAALALAVAALFLAPWGFLAAVPHLGPSTAAHGLVLAVLMPVLPCVLELAALRQLPQAAFATLMSFEPAMAAVVGAVVLHQRLELLPTLGVLLVVAAGYGVTRSAPDHEQAAPAAEPVLELVGG